MKLIKKTKLKDKFERYDLEVENTHNFVVEGVVVHNSNVRLGYGPRDDYKENPGFIYMAGSHNCRRKEGDNKYWNLFKEHPKLKILLGQLLLHVPNPQYSSAIIFGELYGIQIQDMHYDATDKPKFRAFDICVDGKYLGYEKYELFRKYDIPHMPILYKGPYSPEIVKELTDGETALGSTQKFKGREGVVITAEPSSVDSVGRRRILKSVSVDYLDRKGATDGH